MKSMHRNIFLLFAFLLLTGSAVVGQGTREEVITQYIDTYRVLAIQEMQRTGVPASIKLAQGILETEAGKSDLVMRSNNHFGIKCKSWWTGEKVYHDDDERGECFRKYMTAEESYKDHSDYLRNTERYSALFRLDPTDYKGWAHGLKAAGYATNPKYPQILIKYIEEFGLNDYSLIALGRKPADFEINVATVAPVAMATSSVIPGGPVVETRSSIRAQDYPVGEFKINNTKVIVAKAGTSIRKIADKYALTQAWLVEFNEMKLENEVLKTDELIFLQRKRKQGAREYHIVEEGEDLYTISQKQGIRLENLLLYNQISLDMVPAPGEKLYLQKESPARPRLAYAQH
jgi:LysM repeat protein